MIYFMLFLTMFFGGCKNRTSQLAETTNQGSSEENEAAVVPYIRAVQPRSFVELIHRLKADGFVLEHTFVPKGRSLVRDHVSADQPRIIVAIVDSKNGWPTPDLSHQVFLGYAPASKQMEVISWNNSLAKMDFFVGRDIEPITAVSSPMPLTLVKEGDETCTVCHQSGIPIFSSTPWADTTIFPYVREIVRAKVGDSFLGLPLPAKNEGLSAKFQESVTFATNLLEYRTIIPRVCDGDPLCNKILIKNAIFKIFKPKAYKQKIDLEQLQQRLSQSKVLEQLDGSIPGAIIVANSPSLEDETDPVKIERAIQQLLAYDPKQRLDSANYALELSVSPAGDSILHSVEGLGFDRYDMKVLRSYQYQSLVKALDSPTFAAYLSNKRIMSKPDIMRYLLLGVGIPEADIPQAYERVLVTKQSSSHQLPPVATAAEGFQRYCGECHAKTESFAPQFALDNMQILVERGSIELIEKDLMPPYSAEQKAAEGYTPVVKKMMLDSLYKSK